MEDVPLVSCVKIVRTDNFVAVVQQSFAQMRAQESGSAGDKDSFFHRDALSASFSSRITLYCKD